MNGNIPNKPGKSPGTPQKRKINPIYWVYILALGVIIYFMFTSGSHEAVLQLRGEAGARQVARQPEVAAVANGGGPIAGCMLLTRG